MTRPIHRIKEDAVTIDDLFALWSERDKRYHHLRAAKKPRLLSPVEIAAVRENRISEALDVTGPGSGEAYEKARNWVQP